MAPDPPDFASAEYWSTRFGHETTFEWLATGDKVVPVVVQQAGEILARRADDTEGGKGSWSGDAQKRDGVDKEGGESGEQNGEGHGLKVLHFGCGTSNLGEEVHQALEALQTLFASTNPCQVVDTDYVAHSLSPRSGAVPVEQLDVLSDISLHTMTSKYAPRGWNLLLDKSTADAISCGPDITTERGDVGPIEVLCDNLARVTRKGGRWLCISYSATRFDHLHKDENQGFSVNRRNTAAGNGKGTLETYIRAGLEQAKDDGSEELEISRVDGLEEGDEEEVRPTWRLLRTDKIIRDTMTSREIPDGKGFRTVYEPETPIWVYILERT